MIVAEYRFLRVHLLLAGKVCKSSYFSWWRVCFTWLTAPPVPALLLPCNIRHQHYQWSTLPQCIISCRQKVNLNPALPLYPILTSPFLMKWVYRIPTRNLLFRKITGTGWTAEVKASVILTSWSCCTILWWLVWFVTLMFVAHASSSSECYIIHKPISRPLPHSR